jgi:hypothetical protein
LAAQTTLAKLLGGLYSLGSDLILPLFTTATLILMFKILVLACVGVLLVAMNPSHQDHRLAIRSEMRAYVGTERPIASAVSRGVGKLIGVDPIDVVVDVAMQKVTCRSYLAIASSCQYEETPISFGVLGKVWAGRDLEGLAASFSSSDY